MPTLQEEFSAALHHSSRAWKLALDRRLKHLGLGMTGWMTIAIVAKARDGVSQTDIAQAVGVEGATMVVMIDRLVKAGLVERQPSETDRRVKFIALTDDGRALYAKVKSEADAFRKKILSREDEQLLRQATELLDRIRNAAEGEK